MKSFTLGELADKLSLQLLGNPEIRIFGIDTLEDATETDVSFLANPRYLPLLKKTKAAAICIDANSPREEGKNYLLSASPSAAFQRIASLLLPPLALPQRGIHPTAIVDRAAEIGENVSLGPYVVVEAHAKIGANTTLSAHVYVGAYTEIGTDCLFHPHVTVRERCLIGDRVILQPGAVIGSCGFGYTQDAEGRHIKIEQLGIVVLEDDVEVGANSTVDRARFKATIIRKGSKIDNLVQIGHNVELGEHNIVCAQTGIAGSAKTGKWCMFGGQAGILGHIELGDKVLIATRGGVSKSLKTGTYRGSPAIPIQEYNRQEAHIRKIADYLERIKKLEVEHGSSRI